MAAALRHTVDAAHAAEVEMEATLRHLLDQLAQGAPRVDISPDSFPMMDMNTFPSSPSSPFGVIVPSGPDFSASVTALQGNQNPWITAAVINSITKIQLM